MNPTLRIRAASPADADTVARIAVASTLFSAEEMDGFVYEPEATDQHWIVLERDGTPVGAAFYAPEPFSDRMWNLYFLAVLADHQGSGTGTALVEHVEHALRAAGPDVARTLIVETSSLDRFEPTRRFYRTRGYEEVGRVPEFYGPGDDKIVFWKRLTGG